MSLTRLRQDAVLRLLRNSRYSRHVAIYKKDLVRGTQSFKRQRVTPLKVVAGIRAFDYNNNSSRQCAHKLRFVLL